MTLVPATGLEVTDALRRAAAVNPLFAIESGAANGWRPDALDQAIGMVADSLGGAERRVAASMVVLGYSARLVAPALGVLLSDGLVLGLRSDAVRWSYASDAGFRLLLREPAGWRSAEPGPPTGPLLERWCGEVIDGHLSPVVALVQRTVPVATGLLWGNVASSLAGALRVLALTGIVPMPACRTTGEALLAHGPLRDSGRLHVRGGQLFFVRRSCCLYYRLPGGGLCGDCALVDPIERDSQWARALERS